MGTSSKSLIEGAVSLITVKDLQEVLVKENSTYPLNYQPKLYNIQKDANCLGSSIITTNIGKIFVLDRNIVSDGRIPILWTFELCQAIFDRTMK